MAGVLFCNIQLFSVCPTGIQPRLSGIAPGISRLKMRGNLLLKEKAWGVPRYYAFPFEGKVARRGE